LGTYLAELLLKEQYGVISGDIKSHSNPGVQTVYTNIENKQQIDNIVKEVDIVINCTGQVTSPISDCLKQNTIGIKNILEAVLENQVKFLQISSVNVFGSSSQRIDEVSALNPETPYSTAKAAAELLIQSSLPTEKYSIIRLSNLYGAGQEKGILTYLLREFKSSAKKLFFNNNGSLERYYIHVKDAAATIIQLVQQPGIAGCYHLVGPEKYTIKKLVGLFEEVSGKSLPVEYQDVQPWENLYALSDDKTREVLNLNYKMRIKEYITPHFNQNRT
jgi:nucleoside-diphosphate-sugar epimerase